MGGRYVLNGSGQFGVLYRYEQRLPLTDAQLGTGVMPIDILFLQSVALSDAVNGFSLLHGIFLQYGLLSGHNAGKGYRKQEKCQQFYNGLTG